MSGSIIIVTASGFAFHGGAATSGAMLIAALGGLYWGHVRGRRFTLILANAAAFSLAAGFATSFTSIAMHNAPLSIAFAAVAFTCCYWCVNSMIVGAASAIRNEIRLSVAISVQIRSDTWIMLLACASALIAHSLQQHAVLAMALALVALLLSVDALQVRGKREYNDWEMAVHSATQIGISASLAISIDRPVSVALLLIMVYVLGARGSRCSTAMHVGTLGLAVLLSAVLNDSGVPAVVQFALATTAAYVILTTALVLRNTARATSIGLYAGLGLLVISKHEALWVALSALGVQLCLSTRAPAYSAVIVLVLSCIVRSDRGPILGDARGTRSRESAAVSSH